MTPAELDLHRWLTMGTKHAARGSIPNDAYCYQAWIQVARMLRKQREAMK